MLGEGSSRLQGFVQGFPPLGILDWGLAALVFFRILRMVQEAVRLLARRETQE